MGRGRRHRLRGAAAGEEQDDQRKASLVALGSLERSWPEGAASEVWSVYVREVLAAPTAGRRSYLLAAGPPTMTLEQARDLYGRRRYAVGVVAWQACGGAWALEDLATHRDRARGRCASGDLLQGAGLGWTLFEGSQPLLDPQQVDGGPRQCEPLLLRSPDLSGRGGFRVDVRMPSRLQDCGTLAEWPQRAGELNDVLRQDLRLEPADVSDRNGSPATLEGARACGSRRDDAALSELCGIR